MRPIIVEFTKTLCINCVHFRTNLKFPHDLSLGKCSLFNSQDVVTGKITSLYASSARIHPCGYSAIGYTPFDDNNANSVKELTDHSATSK